ncbi:AMP-binding protein [Actinomadura rugatobispora]|uniref:AMP-binding protein n=1 Tax=Actinomadura rugatobispora TaxID=1994 RepID=A0ABW0ZRQ2_9ACTN|nr:AMP-binding protein [Actinomadura rugatobispora]
MTAAEAAVGSIGGALITALRRFPGREALVCGPERLTYAQVADTVARLRRAMEEAGLRPGDTVAQITRNRPAQWLVTAACYLAGFRSACLPLQGLPAAVLRDRLAAAAPALVVVDASRAAEIAGWGALGEEVVWVSDGELEGWRELGRMAGEQPPCGLGDPAPPSAVVRLGYTSGTTTGTAKAVLLSSGALCSVALMNLAQADWPAAPRVLCAEPVAGGFGSMVVPTLVRGGTFVMLETFTADGFLAAAAAHRPNVLLMMPPALRSVLAHPGADRVDWSTVDLMIYSGATLAPAEIDRAHALFGQVLCGIFGQVECPKTIALLAPHDHVSGVAGRGSSLGLPYAGMTVQIQDRSGAPCPAGEAGELCVKGPAVMDGYQGRHDADQPFRDGWLRTGDVCRMDEHGYLHYLNRLENVLDGQDGGTA